jgi:hypothetical protein
MYFTLPNLRLYGQAADPTGQEGFFEYNPTESSPNIWVRFNSGIKVHFKSPDLDSTGKIDLADVSAFSVLFNNGVYDTIIDFNGDGVENIADVSLMSAGCYSGECGF